MGVLREVQGGRRYMERDGCGHARDPGANGARWEASHSEAYCRLRSASRGRLKLKQEPLPNSLSTAIWPP
jgi:hypothetical protein